jgi:beta-xylosidase
VLLLIGAGWLAACTGPLADPVGPNERDPTAGPSDGSERGDGQPTALRPAAGLLFGIPIYDGDFADPFVLADGDAFYAYATNTTDANLPVLRVHNSPIAEYHGDAFPELPTWTEPGFVWAPAVLRIGDRFVLYYTTRVIGTTMQCISRAVATDPLGPFVDDSTSPLVCQQDLGGSIDPSVVTDRDGVRWLLFKNDGNCCRLPTAIWSQRLSSDGLGVEGPVHELIRADSTWEASLVEGPSMVRDGDTYLLFYSANDWASDSYAVGFARCESPRGPCKKATSDAPWMGSTSFARGPGGQEFFDAVGERWMVYHGWAEGEAGRPGAQRRLFLDILDVEGGDPRRVGGRRSWTTLVAVAAAASAAIALGVLHLRRRRKERRRAVESRPETADRPELPLD